MLRGPGEAQSAGCKAGGAKQEAKTLPFLYGFLLGGRPDGSRGGPRAGGRRHTQMGMTNWVGTKPTRAEAVIANNYLAPAELEALNRIVTAYLEFAEVQAIIAQEITDDLEAALEQFATIAEDMKR